MEVISIEEKEQREKAGEKFLTKQDILRNNLIKKYGIKIYKYHMVFLQYVDQIRRRAGMPEWRFSSVLLSMAENKHYHYVNNEIWVHHSMIHEVQEALKAKEETKK